MLPYNAIGTLTIDIGVTEHNSGVDVVKQLGLDIVRVDQTLPQSFPRHARKFACAGRHDLLVISPASATGQLFESISICRLVDVYLQSGLLDR